MKSVLLLCALSMGGMGFGQDVKTSATKADFPQIVSTQLVLDPVQAKYPGNELVKACGPNNHDVACFDPRARHITNRLYGQSKERCEHDEGVACEELPVCPLTVEQSFDSCRRWVPVGKPVFEDQTPSNLSSSEQINIACKSAMAALEYLQKEHPDWKIMAQCGEYEAKGEDHQTTRTTPLTAKETNDLDYRRAVSTVAFHEENRIEENILAAHHIRKPEYSDPCWHYVGIILNDHFITENLPDPAWAAAHCSATLLQSK